MRVEPNLPDHHKYVHLKSLVGDYAMEGLVRLWGHCQYGQRGQFWPGKGLEYVEAIARWKGRSGLFYKACVKSGFIERLATGLVIHDWDEYNRTITSSWVNGRKGGRRHDEPNTLPLPLGNPGDTHGLPAGNPPDTHGQPMGNPALTGINSGVLDQDRIGSDRNVQGGSTPPLINPPKKKVAGDRALGSRVKASVASFAANKQRLAELEAIPQESRTPADRAERGQVLRRLEELSKEQREGFK